MALYQKVQMSDDEEDLEALRLAALQTLGSKPPTVNAFNANSNLQQSVHKPTGPSRGFRGGMARIRSGRNQFFQRHRQNSNLIAIVPVSNEPSIGNDSPQDLEKVAGRGRATVGDSGLKLELPQDRYCKVGNIKDNNTDTPLVSTKFSRYDNSDSDSSGEESEGEEDSSDKMSASGAEEEDEDRDVLTVEDSLDKLMDELEEEMNRSESNVPLNNSKPNAEAPKRTKLAGAKSKHKICDTKSQKSQGGNSTSKTVPVSSNPTNKKTKETSDHKKDQSMSQSISSVHVNISSNTSNHHKDCSFIEKDRSTKSSVILKNCNLPPKTVSTTQRQLSPVLKKLSRTRSRSRSRSPLANMAPVAKNRRSRSPSPRNRYSYSPARSRIPRSPPRGRLSRSPVPRGRLSRSPVHVPRSRSRSPLRPLRSPPRKRYSRSPPWHPPANNHLSRYSPQRLSPRSRRPLSPRRSPSPRLNRLSPRRSPESRWWPSPRRSLSPHLRRSPSPASRHLSPRPRRISVSPRRPLSPIRRRLSPSPVRRNISPSRRFSPRRNASPPRGRYSHSLSRSPDRFTSRGRSPPGSRTTHHVSSRSPKRRLSRSPSPRKCVSRSPFNRLPPRHSPVGRPWTPPKQNVSQRISPGSRRYSNSPDSKQRSLSPYGRSRRRSTSPNRRPPINRPLRRSRSPIRDVRRPPKESRTNAVSTRSRSPLSLRPHVEPEIRRSHSHTRSPRHARSPPRRSRSPTSSISLSPSPEHGAVNSAHRYMSPLRLHTSDYRNIAPIHHTSKENANRQKNVSPHPVPRDDSVPPSKSLKTRSSRRREPRNRSPKRDKSKEDARRDKSQEDGRRDKSKEDSRRDKSKEDGKWESQPLKSKENTVKERISVRESSPAKKISVKYEDVNDPKLAILEARRRKFESKGPVKPDGKKIRLKATQSVPPLPTVQELPTQQELPSQKEKQQQSVVIDSTAQEKLLDLKEEEVDIQTEKSATVLDESELLDTGDDFDLDQAILELQRDLWSSDESNSDNEGRFKSSTKLEGETKVPVLPFTKLLGEPKANNPADKTSNKKSVSSRKTSSGERLKGDAKSRKGVSSNLSDEVHDEGKKTEQLLQPQDRVKVVSKISNPNALKAEMESLAEPQAEVNDTPVEDLPVRNREGDLRAELSRRRAERLTKAGSLHESLPARLLQNAFEGVVGKKILKRLDKEEKQPSSKRTEIKKEKRDGRRVMLLDKRSVEEPRLPSVPSISVTIPKENKRDLKPDSSPSKLPIRMRLGLPSGGSSTEDRLSSRRRNRKVKLNRSVTLGSRPDDKV